MARAGGFAREDEPLDAGGQRIVPLRTSPRFVLTSPALAARQTTEALAVAAEVEPLLRDIDHGRWAGRRLAEVHATESDALEAWIADPARGTPSGESLEDVVARITPWLTEQAERDAPILAITHPMVIRAVLASALEMPLSTTLRIDIAPLSAVVLSYHRSWRLQTLGAGVQI